MHRLHARRAAAAVGLLGAALLGLAPVAPAASGVTRTKPFARPPYLRGDAAPQGARILALPPTLAPAPGIPDAWLPGEALAALVADLDRYLTDEGFVRPDAAHPAPARERGVEPPDVLFACRLDFAGECDPDDRANELTTTGGSRAWRERIAAALDAAGADRALVLQVRVAPQWIHQKNLSGKKEVRLGSGPAQALPWLTSLDTPVQVLQVTAALVDREGQVVRSGAEGLLAARTPFRASMAGAEKLMTAEDVERARTLVRDDLPGAPAVWQAAVHALVRAPAP